MDDYDLYDMFDDLDEADLLGSLPRIKNAPIFRRVPPGKAKSKDNPAQDSLLAELAAEEDFAGVNFTYQASKIEAQWLIESLGYFYQNRWIDDVLRLVKGGKEASVYLCAANPSSGLDFLAAKVYRPRRLRNLRNDHLYREGREPLDEDGNVIIDDGMLHAIRSRSAYGRQLSHTSWIEHEVSALRTLSAAGVDVPRPVSSGHNAILMDYVGDPAVPAPTLNSVHLELAEAAALFERLLENISRMLSQNLIHGDLSAFNLLYWQGRLTLIDFPQAISPHVNRNAYAIFRRDILRVCDYFSRHGVVADPREIAANLWNQYGLRRTPDVHPGLLDDQDEDDRTFWQNIHERNRI